MLSTANETLSKREIVKDMDNCDNHGLAMGAIVDKNGRRACQRIQGEGDRI